MFIKRIDYLVTLRADLVPLSESSETTASVNAMYRPSHAQGIQVKVGRDTEPPMKDSSIK
jgi:hypothetical protein